MGYEQLDRSVGIDRVERVRMRVAALRESAIRQRQVATEYQQIAEQSDTVGDRILFSEYASRAFEAAKTSELRADEAEALILGRSYAVGL